MTESQTSHEYFRQNFTDTAGLNLMDRDITDCNFKGLDLSEQTFKGILDTCVYEDCNLSLVSFDSAKLQGVSFKRCKLLGVDFTRANSLAMALSFEECLISSCNFSFLPLPKSKFLKCDIIEADFGGADLSCSRFSESVFRAVTFHNTNLTKADFTGAHGYQINPLNNKIREAVFSLPDANILLECMGIKLN
jgi:fluoroquinolone resistance protein